MEEKITGVQGNVLRVAIPLTLHVVSVVNGVVDERDEEFYPNTNHPVKVILIKGGDKYPYTASVSGNVVSFEDKGTLPIGEYQVDVLCRDGADNPYRYMARGAVEIVDATIDAGLIPGVEFDAEVFTLRGAMFLGLGGGGTLEQVQSDWDETNPESPAYIKNKPTIPDAQVQADWEQEDETAVDFIKNKPTIPTKLSELEEDADHVTVTMQETVEWSSKQSQLVSGTNIKTINGQSVLGSGNLVIGDLVFGNYENGSFYLGSYVNGVWTFVSLPVVGDTKKVYIDVQNNVIYRWDGNAFTKLSDVDLTGYVLASALATVATSGSYNDLTDKPTIPAAQVQADWNESNSSSKAFIKNKPTIPTVPTNVSSFTNDAGYLTSHQDISGKADKVAVVDVASTGDVTQTLSPNTFYKFGSIDSLAISLTAGSGFVMYAGKFTASANWGSNGLSIPATVDEATNNDAVEAGKTYEFSILDNIIVVKEVA